ncbi:MAG: DUF1232 domain-containing protein [Peptococcaceae bacterium]|nr:DUF1232 domain-containing protein [Peptococcaceae bacterium]
MRISNKNEQEFSDVGELIGDQEIERWKDRAKEYVDDPVKTETLLSKALRKAEKSKNNEVFGNIWDKVQLLFSLVRDWSNGTYRSISKTALLAIIGGLIYFVSPVDVIPDFIVGLGLVDDAAVLGLIINQLDKELTRYKQWKLK